MIMSDLESAGDLLKGRKFSQKPKDENEITNSGTGPYAIPDLKITNSKLELAYKTAKDFGKLDHVKFFIKHVYHFRETVFRSFVAKVDEAKDVRDKGKYLNAIIQEALEKEKLAKKDKDCDNNSK